MRRAKKWLVQTRNTILIVVSWANRGPTKVRTMYAGCTTFWVFFEDCVKSDAQKCLVHHKSIIPDQYASASACVLSRKICFGFQFWLQSFFHATPNVQFARKWLVETRYFSLGEQYYSTAGVN